MGVLLQMEKRSQEATLRKEVRATGRVLGRVDQAYLLSGAFDCLDVKEPLTGRTVCVCVVACLATSWVG